MEQRTYTYFIKKFRVKTQRNLDTFVGLIAKIGRNEFGKRVHERISFSPLKGNWNSVFNMIILVIVEADVSETFFGNTAMFIDRGSFNSDDDIRCSLCGETEFIPLERLGNDVVCRSCRDKRLLSKVAKPDGLTGKDE